MDNLATVQAIYAAFGRGDVPAILEQLADDVRWEDWANNYAQNGGVPWMAARSGKAGALEFFQFAGTKMQVSDFQVLDLLGGGKQVAAEVVIEVTYPDSGGHYRDEELHLWTFNEAGKVVRLRHYSDTAKHIAAANGQH